MRQEIVFGACIYPVKALLHRSQAGENNTLITTTCISSLFLQRRRQDAASTNMVDCKCCKNLLGFAASRPPCFVFTVCLAAFAIGLFSLGYFVQTYGWITDSVDTNPNKNWHSLLNHLGSSEFCIFGNQSFFQNSAYANSSNGTSRIAPAGYATISIPQLDLAIVPSDSFLGLVNNVTHITSTVMAKKLRLPGLGSKDFTINITLNLKQPWSMDCQESKCKPVYLETCGSVTIPADIIPKHLPSEKPSCNASSDINIVEMVNIQKYGTTLVPLDEHCVNGIRAETSVPFRDHGTPTGTLSLVDASAVNLRLQYSSYFLFVLVITCILYGMIKGRPSKQGFSKKSMLPV